MENNIAIHMYSTDGYVRCVESFIDSFKQFHGMDMTIILTLRYVDESAVNDLYDRYSNLIIINEVADYKEDANILGISVENFKRSKKVLEQRDAVPRNYGNYNLLFKQFISVNNRYRNSIIKAMEKCDSKCLLVHFDADTIIKSNLVSMFNYMNQYDVCIKFRPKAPLNSKVLGSLISFKVNEKSKKFLNTWIKYIDSVPLKNREKKYGQISFYYAYRDMKAHMKFGNLSKFDSLIEKSYRGIK